MSTSLRRSPKHSLKQGPTRSWLHDITSSVSNYLTNYKSRSAQVTPEVSLIGARKLNWLSDSESESDDDGSYQEVHNRQALYQTPKLSQQQPKILSETAIRRHRLLSESDDETQRVSVSAMQVISTFFKCKKTCPKLTKSISMVEIRHHNWLSDSEDVPDEVNSTAAGRVPLPEANQEPPEPLNDHAAFGAAGREVFSVQTEPRAAFDSVFSDFDGTYIISPPNPVIGAHFDLSHWFPNGGCIIQHRNGGLHIIIDTHIAHAAQVKKFAGDQLSKHDDIRVIEFCNLHYGVNFDFIKDSIKILIYRGNIRKVRFELSKPLALGMGNRSGCGNNSLRWTVLNIANKTRDECTRKLTRFRTPSGIARIARFEVDGKRI